MKEYRGVKANQDPGRRQGRHAAAPAPAMPTTHRRQESESSSDPWEVIDSESQSESGKPSSDEDEEPQARKLPPTGGNIELKGIIKTNKIDYPMKKKRSPKWHSTRPTSSS